MQKHKLKEIGLGTAMWGWSVKQKQAEKLLDTYYEKGGRWVDTAYNYPLNNLQESRLFPVKLISNWIRLNNIKDLKVIFKLGSLSNKNSPANDLSPANIKKMAELAANYFGANLASLMIHWDNREEYDEIFSTLTELNNQCLNKNVRIGLSGIKNTELYARIVKAIGIQSIDFQAKYSFLEDYPKTKILANSEDINDLRLWAYGISGSGLKLDIKDYRPDSYVSLVRNKGYHKDVFDEQKRQEISRFIAQSDIVSNLYEYAMLVKENTPNIYGYLVSPVNMQQLEGILALKGRLISACY